MSKTVTIMETTFPVEIRPGARISFDGRDGTVIDRAPQGIDLYYSNGGTFPVERSGVWLWVRADDGRTHRVRYRASRASAEIDTGEYVARSRLGHQHVRRMPGWVAV